MKSQPSESLRLGILLALIGGYLDAYTYVCRGGVFANAQTGNIVLFGLQLFNGNTYQIFHYLLPIMSFAIGVFVCEMIKYHFQLFHSIHWRQIIIIIEMIILGIVAFISNNYDSLANCLVSLVCALQVDSFRKIKGYGYATTMCTGNLRSGVEALSAFFYQHQHSDFYKAMHYFLIIFVFILGAILGKLFTDLYGITAVLFCLLPLMIAYLLMIKNSSL